ncbi:MAG: PilZ domain-containing protein [Rhizobiales bacterium]|nr:PilZ domain-containing protein [Hyphomicrobiales bacterium]NRB13889.1 PilZ domain-containing protein [Hyphomicrobiales bacterium]
MKIMREKASQRRHHRLNAPLTVLFKQQAYLVHDWSIGGLSVYIDSAKGPQVGKHFDAKLSLPFQGYDIQFDVELSVVRFDKIASLAGFEFVNLSERSTDLLSYFSEELIRGHMGSFEDSICRIDVPVTPISTQPTTSHISETPIRRLPFRTIFMTIIYVIFGLAIFGYLGILFYSNFLRLEVTSSVISTEMRTLKMPVDGIVNAVHLKIGDQFDSGQQIFGYADAKLEKQIEQMNLNISQAQKNLWRMKQKHNIEQQRMSLYQIVSRTDRSITEAKLAAARVVLSAADAKVIRLQKLHLSNSALHSSYENAVAEQAEAASRVKQTELLLEKNTAMEAASSRRYYNQIEFVTDLDLLTIDLEMAYNHLKVELEKLDILQDIKSNTIIKAPFRGRVTQVYHASLGKVAKNEPILLFERSDQISVTAFLTQKEILQISLNDTANIYIPAINKNIPAIVTRIDRNSLFLNNTSTHYVWRDDKARSGAVILTLNMTDIHEKTINTGLPVVAIFNRKSTSNLWSSLSGFFPSKADKIELRDDAKI